jgi:hypothetical protein
LFSRCPAEIVGPISANVYIPISMGDICSVHNYSSSITIVTEGNVTATTCSLHGRA